jgi:hypothetical protein
MFVEARYRWEAEHGLLDQTGGFDREMLMNMESQAFQPGKAGKYWKAGEGMSVAWPDVTNFGTPSVSSLRGFAEEGGALGAFMNRVPGMNQLSIGHDFFATTFEFAGRGAILRNLGSALNWTSMPVYGAYTYGKWGTEASRRMGVHDR